MDGTPDTEWGKEALRGSWKVEPKYRLKVIVFEDQFGNTAFLEPGIEPPLGTETEAAVRRPTFYGITHPDEFAGALEAILELTARVLEYLHRVEGTPEETSH